MLPGLGLGLGKTMTPTDNFSLPQTKKVHFNPFTGWTAQTLRNPYANKTKMWSYIGPSIITGHSSYGEQHEQSDHDLVAMDQGRIS